MKTEHPSVCPLDCPDTCSLTVTVEDDRIVSIRGSRANPYTAGVLCAKVPEAYPGFVHGEGRLRTPLRRVGAKGEGRFERISWAQALDLVHERFTAVIAAHGPQAILPLNYAGPHGFLAGGSMDLRFFHRLGASLLDRRPLCGGIRTEAWVGTFGPVPGHPARAGGAAEADRGLGQQRDVVEPAHRADHQPRATGGRQARRRRHAAHEDRRAGRSARRAPPGNRRRARVGDGGRARARGAARPRVHRAARRRLRGLHGAARAATRWPTRPGSAASTRASCAQFAEWYRTISPAVITVGNGLERNRNGGSGIRAIFALPGARREVRRAGRRADQRRVVRVSEDARAPGAARLRPGRHAPAQHHRRRPPPHRRDAVAADQGALHLQPQPARRASRPEPPAARPRARGPLRGRLRRGDDGQPRLRGRRAAGVQPLRARRSLRGLRHALAPARRPGDPAAGRGAAQHRDLPAARGALRLHRSRASARATPSSWTTRSTGATRDWAASARARSRSIARWR